MNDITILLTIYNRPYYTLRWLKYFIFNNCPYKLYICDGGNDNELTNKIKKLTNQFNNIVYKKFQYYKNFKKFHEKFFQATMEITSKYTFISEDDDFIIFSNLKKLQDILDDNHEYSCVGGMNIELEQVNPLLSWKYYVLNTENNTGISYEESTSELRCIQSVKKTNSNYNCLHKTENLREIFKYLYELNSNNLWVTELIFILMSAYFGKIKRVSSLTYIKMANIDVSSSYAYFKYINIFSFMTSKNFAKDNYDIAQFLNEKDHGINKENLSKEININLSNFYKQIITEYFYEKKIIHLIRSKMPLKKFIKFFYLILKYFRYSKIFNILCKTNLSNQLLLKNDKEIKFVINFLNNN